MQNRRNLYRLLHVQHDAPAAVIKNSYRTLMQTLRQHPDLGGDEWNAQLLNEAMETLCDPVARAEYDRTLGTVLPTRLGRGATYESGVAGSAGGPACPFCGAALAPAAGSSSRYATGPRCARCTGPIRSPRTVLDVHDAEERRRIDRRVHSVVANLHRQARRDTPTGATLVEFSTNGCAFECTEPPTIGERVLLEASVLSAIGVVRSCTSLRRPVRWRVGLEFLTVEMHAAPGEVFSACA